MPMAQPKNGGHAAEEGPGLAAGPEPMRNLQQTGIAFQSHIPGESKAILAKKNG